MQYCPIEDLNELAEHLRKASSLSEARAAAHIEAGERDLADRELNRAQRHMRFVRACCEATRRLKEKRNKTQKTSEGYSVAFEHFWRLYPNKKGKEAAWRTWQKHKCESIAVEVANGVARAKASSDWLKDAGQFIPHPATWLNRKGWLDEHVQTGSAVQSKALSAALAMPKTYVPAYKKNQ